MNPLTQTLNQLKMNEKELAAGVAGTKNSWHYEYKDSAWVFLGGLPYEMTEGDVICMFSQYGALDYVHLATTKFSWVCWLWLLLLGLGMLCCGLQEMNGVGGVECFDFSL